MVIHQISNYFIRLEQNAITKQPRELQRKIKFSDLSIQIESEQEWLEHSFKLKICGKLHCPLEMFSQNSVRQTAYTLEPQMNGCHL